MQPGSLTLMSFVDFSEVEGELKDGTPAPCFVPHDNSPRLTRNPDSVLSALMQVDASDRDSAVKFMRKFGLVYSPARENIRQGYRNDFRPDTLSAWPDSYMTRPILRYMLFGGRDLDGDGIKTSFTAAMMDNDHRGVSLMVSETEAVNSIKAAQTVVSVILDATKQGHYPSDDDADERLSLACSYANSALGRYMFAIAPIAELSDIPVTPLVYAIAEAVDIALDGEPLKQCKKCGRWFQYKKSVRRYPVQERNRGKQRYERRASYCSDECQRAYNHEKQRAKRAAERAERAAQREVEKTGGGE